MGGSALADGFTSARVSLANLTEIGYAAIGRFARRVRDGYYGDFPEG